MSKKYIIEIEEEPFIRKSALHGEEALYRAVGFNSLVFDKHGLEKLIPFDKTEEEIRVGDEVYMDLVDKDNILPKIPNPRKFIVVCIYIGLCNEKILSLLSRSTGRIHDYPLKCKGKPNFKKTGRHFSDIANAIDTAIIGEKE